MARRNITHVRKMKDPALGYNFFMRFATMPGNASFNVDDWGIKIQTTEAPEITNEHYEVIVGPGIARKFIGRRVHAQTLSIESLEVRDISTWKALNNWAQFSIDDSNIGEFYDDYVTDIFLEAYAQKGSAPRANFVLRDCSLETFGPLPFDTSAADALRVPATLSYFIMEETTGGVPSRSGNGRFGG